MKRLMIGLCILALLPLGALLSANALDARLETVTQSLNDPAAAREEWQRVRPLAASLTDHARLEEIDRAFAELQTDASAARELDRLLHGLSEAEKLYFYNFL